LAVAHAWSTDLSPVVVVTTTISCCHLSTVNFSLLSVIYHLSSSLRPTANDQRPTITYFCKNNFMDLNFDFSKAIAVGADHAGFEYKQVIVEWLKRQGYQVKDFGTHSAESVDYPDFAHPVASSVENGESACGILVCGSGNGVAIAANKHQGIRAALCWTEELAKLSRQHNDANILCIPERFVSQSVAEAMVSVYLKTDFEGGRHQKRVGKIACAVS
jgi:ribose 5-phosphate isomerase B